MAKKQVLKVTQPVTIDGRTQRVDSDGRVVVKTSYVPVQNKQNLENLNTKFMDGLKMKFEVVTIDTITGKELTTAEAKKADESAPAKGKRGGGKKYTADELDDALGALGGIK